MVRGANHDIATLPPHAEEAPNLVITDIVSSASDHALTVRPTVRLSTWTLGAAGGGLFLLSLVLLARRASGGFQRPIDPEVFVATALILAAVSASLRLIWLRTASSSLSHWNALLLICLPTAASAIIGISLMLPGSSTMAATAFWLILLAGEGAVWGRVMVRRRSGRSDRRPYTASYVVSDEHEPMLDSPDSPGVAQTGASLLGMDAPPYPAEHVSQQLTRLCDASGHDAVKALLRGTFAPGQRALSLHIAFCPPLESTPEVQAHQLEGADARIKVGQALPYGARIDLRLQQFSQETETVLIEVLAGAGQAGGGPDLA